ncbi:transcription cofactor vestigial-like protein 2 [Uloborus diversus]|uniref:transcription cofactor vestigial-like protein 2 n=1 Tax=Uloborus diversus TaxID=327109 RepID=UPI00240A4164|nr:transcription cofactor vestigial-like protein 2 [Uloborus diversus]
MSCADVMYQPYSPYFPYHQRSQVAVSSTGGVGPLTPVPTQVSTDYRKFAVVKSHTEPSPSSLDPTPAGSPVDCRPLAAATHRSASGSASSSDAAKAEKESAAEAQYLSANCVLFTYYTGDISSVVDEHFARALSQVTSYAAPAEATTSKGQTSKDGPPMSHRNFPPSFWNSNYQPMSNATNLSSMGGPSSLRSLPTDLTTYGAPDPYHPSALSLHHPQNDPWHYTLTSQAGHPFSHHHRSAHELTSYHHPGMSTVTGASRFGPQYGSLLLQPAVRSAARAAAACASLEKSEGWGPARYHDTIGHMDSNYGAAYGAMTPMPESSNLGYSSMCDFYKLQSVQRSYR